MAAYGGYTNIVKLLLEAHADSSADNYDALRLALTRQHMDVVDLLLEDISKGRELTRKMRKMRLM